MHVEINLINYLAQEAAVESERSADSSAQTQLKEVAQKLAESVNTVRMLQERLKEKESVINKVQYVLHLLIRSNICIHGKSGTFHSFFNIASYCISVLLDILDNNILHTK